MGNILKIPNTLELLCACWNQAENALQADVKDNCPDIDEEAVTQNFHSQLTQSLRMASVERLVESTFLSDLKISFPDLWREHRDDLRRVSRGLIADVTLHKRETEKITGGDFGVMIIRPNVTHSFSSFRITDYRRGILTQAKMKRSDGKWGEFSEKQEQVLPQRLNYLALLLYQYDDEVRRNLSQFGWQLCNGANFDELKDWLGQDHFPNKLNSCEIIKGLGNATIGTDDDAIINEVISPEKNKSLVIRIYWPNGKYSRSEVRIFTRNEASQKAQILARH